MVEKESRAIAETNKIAAEKFSRSICAFIEALGMHWHNEYYRLKGETQFLYGQFFFRELLDKWQLIEKKDEEGKTE